MCIRDRKNPRKVNNPSGTTPMLATDTQLHYPLNHRINGKKKRAKSGDYGRRVSWSSQTDNRIYFSCRKDIKTYPKIHVESWNSPPQEAEKSQKLRHYRLHYSIWGNKLWSSFLKTDGTFVRRKRCVRFNSQPLTMCLGFLGEFQIIVMSLNVFQVTGFGKQNKLRLKFFFF